MLLPAHATWPRETCERSTAHQSRNVLPDDHRDRFHVPVGVSDPVLRNQLAVADVTLLRPELGGVEDVQPHDPALNGNSLDRGRHLRDLLTLQLDHAVPNLEFHARQNPRSRGQIERVVIAGAALVAVEVAAQIDRNELAGRAVPGTEELGGGLRNVGARACRGQGGGRFRHGLDKRPTADGKLLDFEGRVAGHAADAGRAIGDQRQLLRTAPGLHLCRPQEDLAGKDLNVRLPVLACDPEPRAEVDNRGVGGMNGKPAGRGGHVGGQAPRSRKAEEGDCNSSSAGPWTMIFAPPSKTTSNKPRRTANLPLAGSGAPIAGAVSSLHCTSFSCPIRATLAGWDSV